MAAVSDNQQFREADAAVRLLRAQASEHKRVAQRHRRAARSCMEQIAQIRASCVMAGIQIEPEAFSHGHGTNTST